MAEKTKNIDGRLYKEVIIKPKMIFNGPGKPEVPITTVPDEFFSDCFPAEDGSWRIYVPVEKKKIKVKGAAER